MLHIILLILKIAGIVLLAILGLLLLAVCAVLFVPVTYNVRAEKKEAVSIKAVGGWLWRILSVHYMLDTKDGFEQKLQVRFFGIPVFRILGEDEPPKVKKEKKKKKRSGPAPEPKAEAEPKPEESQKPELGPEPAEDQKPEAETKSAEKPEPEAGPDTEAPWSLPPEPEKPKEAKTGIFRKVIYAIRTFCDKIKQTGERLSDLKDTIRILLEKKDRFLEFWRLKEHVRARAAIHKELMYLWKKARPRRMEGYLHFGCQDPSHTGLLMGAASILYAWYPEKFSLNPDFEQEILEGELFLKGHIRGIVFLCIAVRVLWNKDIRHMYRDGKQLIGGSS